ncbi:GNAT family N-acetyltransferase [Fibrella sp. HMF5335]|uniref:GNAT family N-acetyltransferase n=1 Tax=Fibrella rubiginis TaxID=2817060 RepID=A0A939GCY3_9BACT|nr:GNAT family N-acetyltransferase [Fibrella rubiginis]MBO0935488.1 GNAT family N-acetyltransferase [Fibrella rubiginis]
MKTRPASPEDLPFVYECLCELEEIALDFGAFKSIFEANLANTNVHYVIIELDNQSVGFASCHVQGLLHHAGLVGEIQEMYVLPNYRSQGVGEVLIRYFMDLARRENWVHLEVTSNRRRTRTHTFYERMGFVQTSLKFVWRREV